MKANPEIYEMELHQSTKFYTDEYALIRVMVVRVPGGWIYRIKNDDSLSEPVFVPYNEEFLAKMSDKIDMMMDEPAS